MNQKYTLHTHTIGFDGQNSVQDMVARAKELGFNTLGISNHFIVHPDIMQSVMYKYSVRGGYANIYSHSFESAMYKFMPHYEAIENIKSQNPDITILRGMEVDFFESQKWRDGFERCIAVLRPDYIIGSCHLIEYDNRLLNSHDWKNADADVRDILLQKYWNKVMNAGQSGLFTWMAHLDLPKKVGLGREEKWREYESRATDAIAKSNGAIEINTGLYRTYCYEPYPSNRILQMVADRNIPVIISDDAHAATQIGRHFDLAEQLMTQYKLSRFQCVK